MFTISCRSGKRLSRTDGPPTQRQALQILTARNLIIGSCEMLDFMIIYQEIVKAGNGRTYPFVSDRRRSEQIFGARYHIMKWVRYRPLSYRQRLNLRRRL